MLKASEILKQGGLRDKGKHFHFNATLASQMMIFSFLESANVIGILHAVARHVFEFENGRNRKERENRLWTL